MKEKTKKILRDLGNIVGYGSAITYTSTLGWILYKVHKYGSTTVIEPKKHLRLGEIIGAGCTVAFLIYKVLKDTNRKEKSLK